MKPSKGLRQDELPIDQLGDSWRNARNIIYGKRVGSISNEEGVDNITPSNFPAKRVIGEIPIYDGRRIIFFVDEIGIFNGSYQSIFVDNNGILGMDIFHPVSGCYEIVGNDIIAAWTNNLSSPKILNLSRLPFRVDGSKQVLAADLNKAKNIINLTPNYKIPLIKHRYNGFVGVTIGTGGNLNSGVYYPIIKYGLNDGTTTNWSSPFNGIPIIQDNLVQDNVLVQGGIPNSYTGKYINLYLSDVDSNYDTIQVGYIYVQNGITRFFQENNITRINRDLANPSNPVNVSVTIKGVNVTEISSGEALISNIAIKLAKTITSIQSELQIGNVQYADEINLQSFANRIKVLWARSDGDKNVVGQLPHITDSTITITKDANGSFANGSKTFFNKSFKSGEVYALYIRGKLTNGTYTKAFHIPGRPQDTLAVGTAWQLQGVRPAGNDKDIINMENGTATPSGTYYPLNNLDNGANIYRYQIKNTATVFNSDYLGVGGEMGFWENENELYPVDPNNPTTAIHPDFTNVPLVTYNNRKVRHHVFPDLTVLNNSDYGTNVSNVKDFAQGTFPLNGTNQVTTSVFGIQVTFGDSIALLPQAIRNQLDSYEILFAKRTNENIRIITQDMPSYSVKGNSVTNPLNHPGAGYTDFNRFLSFDLLFNKSGLRPNYVKTLTKWTTPLATLGVHRNFIEWGASNNSLHDGGGEYQISQVVDSVMLGQNVSNGKYNNVGHPDCLHCEIYPKIDNCSNDTVIGGVYSNTRTYKLMDLCIFKRDMYKDFNNQELISTGYVKRFKDELHGEGTVNTYTEVNWGGDIFVSRVSQPTIYTNDLGNWNASTNTPALADNTGTRGDCYKVSVAANRDLGQGTIIFNVGDYVIYDGHYWTKSKSPTFVMDYMCESISNIQLRNNDITQELYFAPHDKEPTPSYYGYDKSFNCINDWNKADIYYPTALGQQENITVFSTRVLTSQTQGTELKGLNWRIFKVNDYYDMPKDRGQIWSLKGINKTLYIHHEKALFLTEMKDAVSSGTSNALTYLGTSQLFDRPPLEVVYSEQGYCGTQSQYAVIVCDLGYCFINAQRGSIFILPQGSYVPQRISEKGMFNFFQNNCAISNDNPFIGEGFTMTYDSKYKRLIVGRIFSGLTWVLSYSPLVDSGNGGWVSFHDYNRKYVDIYSAFSCYFSSMNGEMYSYTYTPFNYGTKISKIFRHNSINNRCNNFDNEIKPSFIDIVFNDNPEITKNFNSINWISLVEKSSYQEGTEIAINNIYKDETITSLIMYNYTQCSDEIDIAKTGRKWFSKDSKNIEGTWTFDDFNDVADDTGNPFFDKNGDFIMVMLGGNLVKQGINNLKNWFQKSRFISKFVNCRLIFNNLSQKDIHISYIETNETKSNR